MLAKSPHNKIRGSASRRDGQSLVEALVAMGVILFGVLGVFALLTRAIGLNRVVSDRYTATYLAGEGIEVVKNILDTNIVKNPPLPWNNGVSSGTYEVQHNTVDALQANQDRPLFFDPNTKLYQYTSGTVTTFKRVITVQLLSGGNEIQVNSQVDYNSHGGTFSINLEDHFYNWR